MLKKLLASVVVATYLLTAVLVPSALAQQPGPWYNQDFQEWYTKVYDTSASPESEIFGERYTAAQVEWVIYGLVAFMMNHLGDADLNACLLDPSNADPIGDCIDEIVRVFVDFLSLNPVSLKNTNEGLAARENVWLATFFERPISSVAYFKDVAGRLQIIPEVKAQGFGFGAANPVLELWRVVRNVTYFLLILVIIVMAFMIMFRVKISPQAVITVQSALPKLVIAIVLITFSYAIAGFLIDLMYVVLGLLSAILTTGTSSVSSFTWSQMFSALTTRSALELMLSYFLSFSIVLLVVMSPSSILGGIFAGFGYLLALVIILLALIVLLIAAIRILWLLLRTFVMILLNIIVGPVLILLGTVGPGGFGTWLRGIAAHLVVYPVVGFMFVMAFVFLRGALDPRIPELFTEAILPFNPNPLVSSGGPVWEPPLTLGTGSQDILWLGASFVTILLIPNVANIIQSLIQGRPFAFGTAIGQAVAPWPVQVGYRGGLGTLYEYAKEREGARYRALEFMARSLGGKG